MTSNANILFQEKALQVMKLLYPEKLVLANTCAYSIDFEKRFPSIPVDIDNNNEIEYLIKSLRKRSKRNESKRSIVHKPDIGIVDHKSIKMILFRGEKYKYETKEQWDNFFNENKLRNSKNQHLNITIFDENVSNEILCPWIEYKTLRKLKRQKKITEKQKKMMNSTDVALILKEGIGFKAVADAKNYSTIIRKDVISKLKTDSYFLAADSCFIICRADVKKPIAKNIINSLEEYEQNIDKSFRIFKIINYNPPNILSDRNECRKKFSELKINGFELKAINKLEYCL